MVRISIKSLTIICVARLSLLLQLSTNIGAYVALKIDKRTQLPAPADERSQLLLRVRRERTMAKIITASKVNAGDERQSICTDNEKLSAGSTSHPHQNGLEEISDAAFHSLTSPVSTNLSLAQSDVPTLDPFIVPIEWLRVQDAGSKGRGLFALHAIEKNSVLGDYIGEVLSYRQYSARYPEGDAEYIFLTYPEAQRRDNVYVDAVDESKSNIFR